MTAAATKSPMVSQIDETLKTLRNRSLIPHDEVVDRLLDLRAVAELADTVARIGESITDTDAL